ncbi:MAG: ClpXP protease specificity-enhancing factor [Gallionellaceae bacterium]
MTELSTKPYLIRAIHEWCSDSSLTPYLAVRVCENTRVPMAFVKDGEIVLNVCTDAVRNLHMGNEEITCSGRFGGVPQQIVVPIESVVGIFAKETGQGLVFEAQQSVASADNIQDDVSHGSSSAPPTAKSHLRVIK